jgi:hypothetical protein
LLGGKEPTHGEIDRTWDMPDRGAVEPGLEYDPDKLRVGHGGLVDKNMWKMKQFRNFLNYSNEIHRTLASISATPRATHGQWSRHDGSKTQDIRVTINSSDPHSAAHETARQLAHLQNQTMRDWRRVG